MAGFKPCHDACMASMPTRMPQRRTGKTEGIALIPILCGSRDGFREAGQVFDTPQAGDWRPLLLSIPA